MNCPHCQQPITRAQIASALANTAPKGKGARPGAAKLVRNPYGRKGRPLKRWTERRIRETDWKVGEFTKADGRAQSAMRFKVYDPDSGFVGALTETQERALSIITSLRAHGRIEPFD